METKKSDTVPQYYSKNRLVRNLFWQRLKLAISLARLDDNPKVLDVGAGSGELMELVLRENPGLNIKGIDIKLHTQDRKLKSRIKIGSVTEMPFKNNEFDVVFALDTLEHIKDLKKAVLEIKRILKNNGILVISAPSETVFYKLCRFLEKGTTSSKEADSSEHYYGASRLKKEIKKCMKLEKEKFLPFHKPFNLFNIIRFRNLK